MVDYTIAHEYTLPSQGKVYNKEINPNFKLRSMTTAEEMKRLNHSDKQYKAMSEIIDDCLVDDIGILISDNPVAIDKASYDLINKQKGYEDSSLRTNHEINEDKFKGIWRLVDSQVQFDYAEELGLGNQVYELIEI